MKATDFNNLTGLDFRNMTKAELRALVSDQGARANVRYQNIKSRPDTSKEATAKVDRSGGRFSTKGKTTHKALVMEAKRIQEFNRNPAGNVRGAKQAAEQIEGTTIGKAVKDIVKEEVKERKKSTQKKRGKKLSKKEHKKIEKEGKKLEKELRERVKQEWNKYTKSKQQEGFEEGADYDVGDTGSDKDLQDEINKTQSTTDIIEGQEAFYLDQENKKDSPFTNVNDSFDEINKKLGYGAFI